MERTVERLSGVSLIGYQEPFDHADANARFKSNCGRQPITDIGRRGL